MACYNAERYVAEAVQSALSQTWPDTEVVVVDDGSTDHSLEVLARFGNRIRVIAQHNEGPYPARNRGAAAATGEFLAFLDADDWWEPTCLARLHAALVQAPDAAVAYCGWQNVGVAGGRGKPYVPPDYEAEDKLEHLLSAAAPWPIHAALIRRAVFDDIGGFDTSLRTCMDYDLWLRAAATRRVVRVPEVLAFYRFHEAGQISSTQWRQAENTWRIKKKYLAAHPAVAADLGADRIAQWVDGALLRRGYELYWKRDLFSARKVFRLALGAGAFKRKDLRYLLPALLPFPVYQRLVKVAEKPAPKA